MLDGVKTPESPAWWIKTLATALQDRRQGRQGSKRYRRDLVKPARVRPGLDLLHDHLVGDPPLLGMADGWREHFRTVARIGRLNFAETIMSAKSDRMGIRGFRTVAAGDELGDKLATELMKRTGLKVVAREVHDGMLSLADGYGMVTPPAKGEKWPTATAEDARECITVHDPATGRTLAGLKLFRDAWDTADIAHLYVADETGLGATHYKAIKKGRTSITDTEFRLSEKAWEWDEKIGADGEHMAVMPLHRFKNRRGRGEFEWHLDTLDRINDQILDKLIIAKVQAFRQQAIKGLPESERKLVDGKMVDVELDYSDAFVAAPGSLWQVPEGVEFWESQITDLRPLLESIKDDLRHLSASTSTPLHIISPDAAQGSAEGASLMRESHTDAVGSCRDYAALGWQSMMAAMFALVDDAEHQKRADKGGIEVLWSPLERFSLAERADAASKASNLPLEAQWRDIWQYDPSEIANLRTLMGRDLLAQPRPQPRQQQPGAPAAPTFQAPAFPPANGQQTGDPAAAS